jgi:hypothetical protein
MVEVQKSNSIFLQGMAGSRMPIAIAHGEGHAEFASEEALLEADLSGCVAMRYVDNHGKVTEATRQPERLAARDHRPDQPRRPRDHHDAAPGACSAPCRTPGARTSGEDAPGCACSVTRASG